MEGSDESDGHHLATDTFINSTSEDTDNSISDVERPKDCGGAATDKVASPSSKEFLNDSILWDNSEQEVKKRKNKGIPNTTNKDGAEHKGETDCFDKDEEHAALGQNIYSFIFFSRVNTKAFMFAIGIYFFQMAIILCTLISLFDLKDEDNPLKIPPDVETITTVGQVLATMLVPFTMNDVLEAIVKFQEGYQLFEIDVRVLKPGSSSFKWNLSVFLQFSAGAGLLVVIFILIMQAETVIGIMLNFAALQFISEIDDIAFTLAQTGFIAKEIRLEAEEVASFKRKLNRKASNKIRRTCFGLIFVAFMVGMGIILHQQARGDFLCDTINVQFDDEINPTMSGFSGTYEVDFDTRFFGRASYFSRRSEKAMIAYCGRHSYWTLTTYLGDDGHRDPCEGYIARSDKTDTFDVTKANSGWMVYSDILKASVPFKSFDLWCNQCSDVCDSERGYCDGSRCICQNGYFGYNCRYTDACEVLAMDRRHEPFTNSILELSQPNNLTYNLLRGDNDEIVIVYGYPVYYRKGKSYYRIMYFTGSRWSVERIDKEDFNSVVTSPNEFHYYFVALNNSNASAYHHFYSDPVSIRTPDTIRSTPAGLDWYKGVDKHHPTFDMISPIGSRVLCANCNDADNQCMNAGRCLNGTCACKDGYLGHLCELEEAVVCSSADSSSGSSAALCLNGGKCNNETGKCECSEDFYGNLCQLERVF